MGEEGRASAREPVQLAYVLNTMVACTCNISLNDDAYD